MFRQTDPAAVIFRSLTVVGLLGIAGVFAPGTSATVIAAEPAAASGSTAVASAAPVAAATTIANTKDSDTRFTEFRGVDGKGTVAEDPRLPLKWSDTENVTWRVPVAGLGWSTPIVLGDRLIMTTAVKPDEDKTLPEKTKLSLRVVAADRATGNIDWSTEVFALNEVPRIHNKNSYASPTAVTDGEHIFVHFGPYGTAALNPDGTILWQKQEFSYMPMHGNGGSPVLVGDLLVFSCDGFDKRFVVACDKRNGDVRWKQDRSVPAIKGFSFGTPLVIEVDGKQQIVSAGSGIIAGYDPADGREIWHATHPGYSQVPRPLYSHGLIFLCTGYDRPQLMAIRPDGTGDVTQTHVAWTLKKATPLNPTPLILGDELYLISDDGIATCLDAATGKQHWQQRLGGNYSASIIAVGDRIYITSEQGDTFVLKAGKQFEELAKNSLGGGDQRAFATPIPVDGAFYIRLERELLRIENKTSAAVSQP